MASCVINHYLHRALGEQALERAARGLLVRHVEGNCLRRSAGLTNIVHHALGFREVMVGMHRNSPAGAGEVTADRGTDRPAAAGD
jgi:hypothetical protein